MKTLASTLAALGVLLVPTPLFAHEGHGFAGTIASMVHWLTSPFHLAVLAALVVVAVGVPLILRRVASSSRSDVTRWG